MTSMLRGCFSCRSCRREARSCWSRCSTWITMRLPNVSIFRGQRAQAENAVPDGHQPPKEEETQRAVLTFQQTLEAQLLSEASQMLIQREERLFGEITEAEALVHHEEEKDKLAGDYAELEGLLLQTLETSLVPGEVSIEALTSAVKAIVQEGEQDLRWKQRAGTPPAWRPKCWRKLHDEKLRSLVEQRMDNPSTPPPAGNQSSIQADIHSLGRQLKEDLLWVEQVVKRCYPRQLDICNFYAKLYHQNLSSRLRKIAEFVLDNKDCTFLLRWVNEFYPEILQKPEFAGEIDAAALGKLLPNDLLAPLEEQFLSKQQDELTTYVGRVLEEAKKKWSAGEEPTREDDCFVSPVAYDIIQGVHGMVTSAAKIVGDQPKAQIITNPLKDLMQRFNSFHTDIMKQKKPNSRSFIKANLGCIEQFRDVFQKNSHLFQEDVRTSCALILDEMKQSGHTFLLKPVHDALKPQYRKLGTSDWLNKNSFETLLNSITEEVQDLQGSTEASHEKLIGQLHQEVTTEYVKRLLKGEVKLKDREMQLKAFKTVKSDAESLHELFSSMGSKEGWLKEVLIKIAEVLKLQDCTSVQMEVVSLGTAFPDLSARHVSALLKLKTNFTRSNRRAVKETLLEALEVAGCTDNRPFFCSVQVK
ncbi:tumor necrosis factor alpha-induced protein 2 isoform X1 [Acanthopagrus latus]|uniref:tumor necrosis factor alpha-induced protein 2 isoform X1 n=2 Tax=Acanthopagrus latus TaxID=8177 RepID=UPI00187CEA9D|nr:tumor necrosis factor alpha-induced protein 2 isoform X1 [Acanthopagrus latus]